MALCTIADLERIVGDIDDTLAQDLIDQSSSIIDSYVGRSLEEATYTDELYDGHGVDTINLRNYPVTTFTILARRDTTFNTASFTTIDAEDYFVDDDSGVIQYRKGLCFIDCPKAYRVTYTAGYTALNVPDDLCYATATLAAQLYRETQGGSSGGVESESIGDYTVRYDTKEQIKGLIRSLGLDDILDAYYNPRIC